MKYLAIILASVAALAATAQTYLIWSADKNQPNADGGIPIAPQVLLEREQNVAYKRHAICKGLIESFAQIKFVNANREELINEFFEIQLLQMNSRSLRPGESVESREEKAKQNAETEYFYHVTSAIRRVLSFQDYEYYYFDNSDVEKFDFASVVNDLPAVLRIARIGRRPQLSGDSYQKAIIGIDKLANKAAVVESVCKPVVLGGDN